MIWWNSLKACEITAIGSTSAHNNYQTVLTLSLDVECHYTIAFLVNTCTFTVS